MTARAKLFRLSSAVAYRRLPRTWASELIRNVPWDRITVLKMKPTTRTKYSVPHMIQSIVCTLVTNVARQATCSAKNGSELTQTGTRRRGDRRTGRGSVRGAVEVTVLMADPSWGEA